MNKLVINYNGVVHVIQVRDSDGYLNATQLCKVGDKLFGHYMELKSSNEYHKYLCDAIDKTIGELIINKPGSHDGTWVHKEIAYHIASWVSPIFMHQLIKTYDRLQSGDLTLVRDVVQNHDTINNTQSKVLIQSCELDLIERRERLEQLKISNEKGRRENELLKVQVERELDTLDVSGSKAYSSSINLLRELNGSLTETDKRYFNDLIKNNVARRSTLLAVESRESYEERKHRFVIPVSDIYKDLSGKPGNHRIWIQLGKELARGYRSKYNKEPSKLESFVDGKTRMINAYNTRDDPWILEYTDRILKANPGLYNM